RAPPLELSRGLAGEVGRPQPQCHGERDGHRVARDSPRRDRSGVTLQTEFPFTLPRGFVDPEGDLHRDGIMRLATPFDEIAPMKGPRVQANPGYLAIILLSRVVIRLGTLPQVNPKVVENLFAGDMAFLEDLYRRINGAGRDQLTVTCPHCERTFDV